MTVSCRGQTLFTFDVKYKAKRNKNKYAHNWFFFFCWLNISHSPIKASCLTPRIKLVPK